MRLAYLVSHPIQYQAPLLRRIAAMPNVDLHVFFQSDISLRAHHDGGFGREIAWDVPLVEGYAHSFLPARFGSGDKITGLQPFSRGLGRTLRKGDFDVLWAHGFTRPYSLLALLQARALGLGLLVREDMHSGGNRRVAWRQRLKRAEVSLLRAMDAAFLSIGTLNAEYYQSLGVEADRIFLAPYAVDNAFFRNRIAQAAPGRAALRLSLGVTDDAPILLFAGKFIGRKRPEDLLAAYRRALPKLQAAGGPAPWLIYAGSGELLEPIQAAADGLDRVRFLGFQTQGQLAALFDLCDAFILPSATEPWGLVVNEVMNAGKPVVATDQSGCWRDLVLPGETGFVFPTGDVEALCAHIVTLCLEPDLRLRMGKAALALIDRWDFEADAAGLAQALDWLAERRPRRRSRLAARPMLG